MRDLDPLPPTWDGATNASGADIGEVCKYSEEQWFVWRSPFLRDMRAIIVSNTKPSGGRDNQKYGTNGAASVGPHFCHQYATLDPHWHSRG